MFGNTFVLTKNSAFYNNFILLTAGSHMSPFYRVRSDIPFCHRILDDGTVKIHGYVEF